MMGTKKKETAAKKLKTTAAAEEAERDPDPIAMAGAAAE